MDKKLSWAIFWALVAAFVVIAVIFIAPAFREALEGFAFAITSGIILTLLGGALIFSTLKEKVGGILKKFFLLTGASAAGITIFVLLHNAIYALFIFWFGANFWKGGEEPFFFILAIIVCPIGFLVGAMGSIVLAIKNLRAARKST